MVRHYLRQFRAAAHSQRPRHQPLSVRRVVGWIMADSQNTDATDDQPALHFFVRGLRSDQDAVTAGLTLPWSSGGVEGHGNRVAMLKHQVFGRAKPDVLRKRVLLAD
ncbi:transposase [Amycolatopsis cihanbeyliensis]|nr:transposase [Amycolatopsis cihanbeyliensis]